MLATLLTLVLAVHGGLFAGTVLYSAYKASRADRISSAAQKLCGLPLIF